MLYQSNGESHGKDRKNLERNLGLDRGLKGICEVIRAFIIVSDERIEGSV